MSDSSERTGDDVSDSGGVSTRPDPVCGMKVDPATAPSSVVKDVTYYFCCERCQRTFDRKPHLYIGHAPGR